jgi:hypothetical protein
MKQRGSFILAVVIGLLAGRGVLEIAAQDVAAPPKPADSKQAADSKPTGPTLNDLPAMLKASPGCLGVETAKTESGKVAIFSWFENKEAVLKWYYGDAHQALISRFFPNAPSIEPLKDVPDNSGPIMVIASVTFNDPKSPEAAKRPFKQIAIELYQPLPGGLAFGGRFAPEGVKVPGMKEKK